MKAGTLALHVCAAESEDRAAMFDGYASEVRRLIGERQAMVLSDASDIRGRRAQPIAAELVEHSSRKYNLTKADASEWTERFLYALIRDIERRRK